MAVSDDERVAAATKARLGLAYRPTAHGWEIVVADHEPSVVECACGALVVPSKRGCPVCKVTADANLQIPT
ncbi:MAG: hypothetical protein KatS3mg082_1416 [Nitrospiraceae bacterium]|nr:MAG: hypothetical protein KatS3mg082_1416 [Nitrospiraceae bacterium]